MLLIAHGRYVNETLKLDIFRAISMSVKPSLPFLKTAMKNWGMETLRKLVLSITDLIRLKKISEPARGIIVIKFIYSNNFPLTFILISLNGLRGLSQEE